MSTLPGGRLLHLARSLARRPDFLVLILCKLILGLCYSLVLPFMSLFGTREVGMDSAAFGIFMTLNALCGMALSVHLARWSDTRFSRKTMLLFGSVCGAIGYLAYAYVRDPVLLLILGGLFLGVSSLCFSQLFALARNLLDRSDIPLREIPLYMNVFRLCYALSWTIGPALAAWLMHRYGFRGTFLASAALFALLAAVIAVAIPFAPPSAKSREAAAALPLRKAFRLPGLFAHFAGFVLFASCSTMGMMNLPLLIVDTLGGDQSQVGIAYGIAPIFEIPFMLYLGFLAARIESSRIIRGSMVVAMLYYASLCLAQSPWQIYPLQILSAAVVAVTSGLAITFFQDYLPHQAGTATNLYSTAMRIGSTLGYLLFGSLGAAFGFRSVFAVCAALSGMAFLIMHAWRPRAALARAGTGIPGSG